MEHMEVELLREQLDTGFDEAYSSRRSGKEGRARVQARILAGKAIEQYANRMMGFESPRNAWEWLVWLSEEEAFPVEIVCSAQRLTVRVTPSFTLPHPEDPLVDAKRIVDYFLNRLPG
ncbi:MAG: hypothetical protein JXA25_11070 [Anaerolineales bacterium]|nr:hypothetical protein [Anaerolineales bacterium]